MENQNYETLASTIKENMKPEIVKASRGTFEDAAVAIVPEGMSLKSLKPFVDEYREKPDRRTGTINADTIQSFIDITNRFKSENSAIFAKGKVQGNRIDASLTTIFNYHPASDDNTDAAFADHRAHYSFPLAKDFAFWLEKNGEVMSQIDFALLVEERIVDMAAPVAHDKDKISNLTPHFAATLDMLELSRDLELYSKETLKSRNKLSSGETELKFSSEHVDATGQPVTIPDFFILDLPIFDGGEKHRIIVRLRYRLRDNTVLWFYDLYRIDRVFEAAFQDACSNVQAATSIPLYIGSEERS